MRAMLDRINALAAAVPPKLTMAAGIVLILGMIPLLQIDSVHVLVPMAGGLAGVWLVFKGHERRQIERYNRGEQG